MYGLDQLYLICGILSTLAGGKLIVIIRDKSLERFAGQEWRTVPCCAMLFICFTSRKDAALRETGDLHLGQKP